MRDVGRFLGYASLAVGLVLAVATGANALLKIKGQGITVTGSAKKRIASDLIVWKAVVKARAPVMADAYKQISSQAPQVIDYMTSKGVSPAQMVVSSISTRELHGRDKDGQMIEDTISSYEMSQEFVVRSSEVDKITSISREATELINQGILLESRDPEYHCTRLADIKVGILAEAGKDARLRAEQIAANTGAKIASLRSARMGVMQVNPAGSTQTSAEGNNDLTSREKDVIAIVTASFAVK
jgi:uncharacterized protein